MREVFGFIIVLVIGAAAGLLLRSRAKRAAVNAKSVAASQVASIEKAAQSEVAALASKAESKL